MCGRYVLKATMSQLKETYGAAKVYEFSPSYNVAPTFEMPVLLQKDQQLMSFAGLYENWEKDGQSINSFTIITTSPNQEMEEIHDRMPAILLPEELDYWLDPTNQDTQSLQDLLRPFPDEQIQYHPVSKAVNSPKNQGEQLTKSIT